MLPPRSAVLAPSDALDHLLQGGRDCLHRRKMVLQQSASRAADVESRVQQLGVQQQLAATKEDAASVDVSNISSAHPHWFLLHACTCTPPPPPFPSPNPRQVSVMDALFPGAPLLFASAISQVWLPRISCCPSSFILSPH